MNYQPVTWITPEEINTHISSMLYHSRQIDIFKDKIAKAKPKKNSSNVYEDDSKLTPIEVDKIKEIIENESKAIRWEELLLKIKLKFFYQNSSGIALPPNSPVRRPHAFTKEEYMKLKNSDFDRKAIARASYLQLQAA